MGKCVVRGAGQCFAPRWQRSNLPGRGLAVLMAGYPKPALIDVHARSLTNSDGVAIVVL